MLLSLASCTTSDDIFTGSEELAQQQAEENVLTFGTFVGDAKQTRAGAPGDIVAPDATGDHKLGSEHYEFGVFGYYHDNANYNDASSTPNYMYNQKVEYKSSAWEYTPIKYWPNEFDTDAGTTNGKSAGVDKLTFFAYAPFVNNEPSDGKIGTDSETSGILAFVKHDNRTDKYMNATGGDPRIHFKVDADPTKCVDLLWGVAPTSVSTTPFDYEIKDNATTEAGKPWLNVTKQTTDGKVTFDFKHALAKLTFTVDADVDKTGHDHTNALDANTKIFVRKVVISGKGMTDDAYLNLNNTTASEPLWETADGTAVAALASDQVFTFHDGRTEGKEGNEDKGTPDSDSGNSATETVVGLNSVITQTATTGAAGSYALSTNAGVTKEAVDLLSNNGAFYVIPTSSGAAQNFTIQIIYDVLTKDDNLAGTLADGKIHGSLVQNDISQTASITIQAGKVYAFKLHLGMTSVKMEGSVSVWGDPDAKEVDLPINKTTTP